VKYKYYKKQIAPRLMDKECRENYTGGLPPLVKEGLYAIARKEKKSVSWVLETLIIDYFGLRRPAYKLKKVSIEEQEKHIDKMTEMGLGKTLIQFKGIDEINMLKGARLKGNSLRQSLLSSAARLRTKA